MPVSLEWDDKKNQVNRMKHKVDFNTAQYAFIDPKRIIAEDPLTVSKKKDTTVLVKSPNTFSL